MRTSRVSARDRRLLEDPFMRLVHRLVVVAALAALAVLPGMAHPGWGVGIRIGGPVYPYGGYYYGGPYYYPYGYYYGAPPVVVAPTVVQPGVPVAQPTNPAPTLQPVPP